MHSSDVTYLNIGASLQINAEYSIGRGCRIIIGKSGSVKIGKGGYINSYTQVIIMNRLVLGNNCVVSWDCQFLEENFCEIDHSGKKQTDNTIEIGNHV